MVELTVTELQLAMVQVGLIAVECPTCEMLHIEYSASSLLLCPDCRGGPTLYEMTMRKLERLGQLEDMRPEVLVMARAMEDQLRLHEDKGGWKEMSVPQLQEGMEEEIAELNEVLDPESDIELEDVSGSVRVEAADVCNYVMMIADIVGALDPTPETEQESKLQQARVARLAHILYGEPPSRTHANADLIEDIRLIVRPMVTDEFVCQDGFVAGHEDTRDYGVANEDASIVDDEHVAGCEMCQIMIKLGVWMQKMEEREL